MPLRFHWRMLQGGEESFGADRVADAAALPDLEAQTAFCRDAEACGIDSLLVDFDFGKPDPLPLSLALALASDRVTFMVAHRPGLCAPTLLVQQVNTFSLLAQGRISLNVVAGHSPWEQRFYGDFLSHDERYERMDEYLAICHAFWDRNGPVEHEGKHYRIEGGRLNVPFGTSARSRPEIFVSGSSDLARQVASRHASCWMRFADTPERIREQTAGLPPGLEIGLRLSLVVRPAREEAVRAARSLLVGREDQGSSERSFVARSDSVSMAATWDWPTASGSPPASGRAPFRSRGPPLWPWSELPRRWPRPFSTTAGRGSPISFWRDGPSARRCFASAARCCPSSAPRKRVPGLLLFANVWIKVVVRTASGILKAQRGSGRHPKSRRCTARPDGPLLHSDSK